MEKKTIWAIAISSVVLIGGGIGAYFYFRKPADETKKDDGNTGGGSGGSSADTTGGGSPNKGAGDTAKVSDSMPNLKAVKQNMGNGKAVSVTGDTVQYKYLDGKNTAVFYDNGRFMVSKTEHGKSVTGVKGSYSNGGKSMTVDGGKKYELADIFHNLSSIRKDNASALKSV